VRFLAADAVERAGSGHPGTAMALAPLATRLYTRWLMERSCDRDVAATRYMLDHRT
jgi:transketolase